MVSSLAWSFVFLGLASSVHAACPGAPAPAYPYRVAAGWSATPVLGNLSRPRGIVVDTKGNLLVLERGKGITGHKVDENGCIKSSKIVVEDPNLNHGIDVHPSGKSIVASTPDLAYQWDYDADDLEATDRRTLITSMLGPGHNTRTLHISRKSPDYLVVSVGSGSNIDEGAFQAVAGRAQIRSFDTRNLGAEGSTFTDGNAGKVLGFGMRNSVGIAEDREGTIHSIDNSVDDAYRVNVVTGQVLDIHNDNPAEKVYALGQANNANESFFGGAPYCYTVYDPAPITDLSLQPGDYFALQPNSSFNDAWCSANAARPSLILPPHTAPLDMKFGVKGDNNLYIGLHGSWNRETTIGYKVIVVAGEYSGGKWVPSGGITTGSSDLLTNQNEANCGTGCFRPVGLAFDEDGEKLYVSSDTSGEVFLLKRGSGAFGGFKNHPPSSVMTVVVALPALMWALSQAL
ncbi:hypothetical protein H1R20_g11771, partial [Candolleomyces eurysporus]